MECVAIVGPADEATEAQMWLAHDIAAALVSAGGVYIVTGGLGGVMASAARGAAAAGGLAIGVIPGLDRREASPEQGLVVATGMGEARNAIVVNSASVIVAVGSSWGTLSEIALARRAGKTVVQIDGSAAAEPGLITFRSADAATPADAVEAVCAAARAALGAASG